MAPGPRDASGRTTPSEPVQTVNEDHDLLDLIGQMEDAPVLKKRTRTIAVPRVKQEVEASAATGSSGSKRALMPSTSKPVAPAPTTHGKAAAATHKRAPSTVAAKTLPESGSELGCQDQVSSGLTRGSRGSGYQSGGKSRHQQGLSNNRG